MGVTISTHNGSIAARDHNIRNEKVVSKEAHINPDGTHEIWIDIKPRDAYDNLFAAAVKDYNDRQTRDDRKIDDYYNDVCKDKKKHPVYEMIIGVYGKDEKGGDLCSEQTGKDIMHEFVDKWHDRNPNLALIGAYYHADEQGQPHVHLDYIPVAHGYSKGMAAQNGLVKALGEQGFEKQGGATAQIQWEARENKVLDDICRSRGLEVDHPGEEYRQHMTTEQYKAQAELDRTVYLTKELLDTHDSLRSEAIKLESQRDVVNKQTQRALERRAKAVKLHKSKDNGYTYDKDLVHDIKAIASEVKEDVKEISHTDLDIQTQYEQAEQFRIQREQLLADGKKEKARLIAEGQEYKNNEKSYILGTAESIANKKFEEFKQEFLHGKQTERLNRLEELCGSIQFKDGASVLDKFEERENELKREMDREWER